jgi:hypothetical protein
MIEQQFAELSGACLQLAENTARVLQIGTYALIHGATSVGPNCNIGQSALEYHHETR